MCIRDRTRHIDAKYHFLRDYVEDGTIKIHFVRSEKNLADIFTKNQTVPIFTANKNELLANIGFSPDTDSGGVSK